MGVDRFWKMTLMMVAIIISDQLSKGAIQTNMYLGQSFPVIDGFFNITYVRNTGAAFGMGAGAGEFWRVTLFLIIPTIVCFFLLYYIIKNIKGPMHMVVAYSLILAGAIGNLIDRYNLGYVVDMFDFYIKTSHFPAFNIADSAITIAGFIIGYDIVFSKQEEEQKSSDATLN